MLLYKYITVYMQDCRIMYAEYEYVTSRKFLQRFRKLSAQSSVEMTKQKCDYWYLFSYITTWFVFLVSLVFLISRLVCFYGHISISLCVVWIQQNFTTYGLCHIRNRIYWREDDKIDTINLVSIFTSYAVFSFWISVLCFE